MRPVTIAGEGNGLQVYLAPSLNSQMPQSQGRPGTAICRRPFAIRHAFAKVVFTLLNIGTHKTKLL